MTNAALPVGWKKTTLDDVAEVQTGIAKGKAINGASATLPYLRVANVQDGYVDLSVVKEITLKPSEVKRYSLRKGDVLFTEGGDFDKLGRGAVWNGQIEPCLHQNHVFAVRPNPKRLLPEFLALQAASHYGRRYFQMSSKQSTNLASINSTQLKQFPVLLPPLPEQHKIAEILRAWDEAIEKLEVLRGVKAQRLDGLRNMLMARGSRAGRPTTFGAFLTESRIPGNDGATARKISVRLYGKGAVEKLEQRAGSTNTRYYRRKAGQIIWSKLDFLNGAFALLGDDLDDCESTLDLPAFDCAPSVNSRWLIEYLTRPTYYRQQIHLARGQRRARRVAPEDWLASPIRLPDRTDQDRIAEIIANARHDVDITAQNIETLTRQKRGVMQKLLTGEWRVKAGE
ncbi:restriction endonuclease subunit S [Tistrella mobilis]